MKGGERVKRFLSRIGAVVATILLAYLSVMGILAIMYGEHDAHDDAYGGKPEEPANETPEEPADETPEGDQMAGDDGYIYDDDDFDDA